MATYQKSNLAWEIQQLVQNGREWLEWQTGRFWDRVPQVDLPEIKNWEWWESLILHGLLWLGIALAIAIIFLNRKSLQRYWRNLTEVDLSPNFPATPPGASYWAKLAQQAARNGDYYQACRHLYLAMLQMLQEQQLADQTPGRTDREYQRLTEQLPQASAYATVFTIHQALCFGQQQASLQLFQDCQEAIALLVRNPKNTQN
jgi:hypothetical protein